MTKFLLLLRPHRAKTISSVRGCIRQTGSVKLDRSISAELLVVNRRFLSQLTMPGETGSGKLAPSIWLGERGSAILKSNEEKCRKPFGRLLTSFDIFEKDVGGVNESEIFLLICLL